MGEFADLDRFFRIIEASFFLPENAQEAARQFLSKPWDNALSTVHSGPAFAPVFRKHSKLGRVLRDAPFVFPALSEIDPQDDPDYFQRTTMLSSWIRGELRGESPSGINKIVREILRICADEIAKDPVLIRLAAQYVLGRLSNEHEDVRISLMQLAAELGASDSLMSERVESIHDDQHSERLTLIDPKNDLSEVRGPRRFFGREVELGELIELLRGGARCITLHGAVGIGKSSLCREAADRLRKEYNGMLALDIGASVDPRSAMNRIAAFLLGPHALDLSPGDLKAALGGSLDRGRRLIVLKDFGIARESDAGTNELTDLLNALPIRSVQMLATATKASTGISGEVPYPSDHGRSLGGLDLGSAVLLCRSYCPGPAVTWDHLSALSESLDGHPLACKVLACSLSTASSNPDKFVSDVRQRSILGLDPEAEVGQFDGIVGILNEAMQALLLDRHLAPVLTLASAVSGWFTLQAAEKIIGSIADEDRFQRLVSLGILDLRPPMERDRSRSFRLHPLLSRLVWELTDESTRADLKQRIDRDPETSSR